MRYRWWPERWTTGRLMVWLAIGSTVLGAWAYSRSNGTSDRAWANHNARALLNAPTPGERITSAEVLEGLLHTNRGGPAALDALVASSGGDADASVRAASVHALGSSFDVASIDPIRRALADRSPEVRLAALEAMDLSGAFRVIEAQVPGEAVAVAGTARRFLADPDPRARLAALELLVDLPDVERADGSGREAQGRPEALAMFERDPDRDNRIAAVRVLTGSWPDASLYRPLVRRLKAADDPEERASIAMWSDRLPPPPADVLATLVEMMDRQPEVVPMAATRVSELDRASAAPYLPAIARAARREAEGRSWSLDACMALLNHDPDSAEARGLVEALGKLADEHPDRRPQVDYTLQARDRALAARALHDMKPAP